MSHRICLSAVRHWAISLLLIGGMLAPVVTALATPTRSLAAGPTWTTSIIVSGGTNLVCVGDKLKLIVTWDPDDSGDVLAPISGPHAIGVTVRRGSLDHEIERPGTVSGVTLFVYTAEKEGDEEATVRVYNRDGNVDAIRSVDFEVKKCSYRYELYAELNDDVPGGSTSYGFKLTYRSKGTLAASDPNNPRQVEGRNKQIDFLLMTTYFNDPNCISITSEPARGFGFLDVKAEPTENGQAMDLKLGPPQDADWNASNTIVCDGEPITAGGVFPISSGKDPWIEHKFPNGEGTYPVQIDILDETVKNASGKGHVISYKATLKMEKVAAQ